MTFKEIFNKNSLEILKNSLTTPLSLVVVGGIGNVKCPSLHWLKFGGTLLDMPKFIKWINILIYKNVDQ